MLKKLSALFLSVSIYLSLAPFSRVLAGENLDPCVKPAGAKFRSLCDFSTAKVSGLIQNGITILFIVAVIAALFFLIFGGIKWITSGGDKAQLETARNTIIAAIIGLILALSSFFILNITLNFFGLPNATRLKIPSLGSGGGTTVCGAVSGSCTDGKTCRQRSGRPGYICRYNCSNTHTSGWCSSGKSCTKVSTIPPTWKCL